MVSCTIDARRANYCSGNLQFSGSGHSTSQAMSKEIHSILTVFRSPLLAVCAAPGQCSHGVQWELRDALVAHQIHSEGNCVECLIQAAHENSSMSCPPFSRGSALEQQCASSWDGGLVSCILGRN